MRQPGGQLAAMLAMPAGGGGGGQQRSSRRPARPAHLDAVIIRNLTYEAGRGQRRKTILNRINLTVPEGSIYGLLGPSGCGKTTMLRCMVGRVRPRAGSVLVFGLTPGGGAGEVPGRDVGYMPQEISIYEDFTIEETLQYFGKINRMPGERIQARIEFLLQFLDLPSRKRTVANLSGGQKRRVSLAAALVHSPPLLILDEPTVGVDPLLRQSIWRHLVAMTRSERISVIITTHYIEEARLANVVGLMRGGRILAENSPDELMRLNGLTNLEDVFLKLCMSDSSRRVAHFDSAAGAGAGSSASNSASSAALATIGTKALTSEALGRAANQRRRRPRRIRHLSPDERDSNEEGPDEEAADFRPRQARADEGVKQLEANMLMRPAAAGELAGAGKATVRINTATNEIELLGEHARPKSHEIVENFSSEDGDEEAEAADEEADEEGFALEGREHTTFAVPSPARGFGLSPAPNPPPGSSPDCSLEDGGALENYLAMQQLQWATRRANLANVMRLQQSSTAPRGRHADPYLGLDGRKRAGAAARAAAESRYERSSGLLQWWETLMAVTWKNYVRLRRNPPVLAFQFLLPAIQVILFCICIGGEPFDVPLAVVNEERVPKSSLEFLGGLDKKVIRQIKYDNLSSAIEAVRRGHVWGALHIPDRYSEHLRNRLLMGEEVTNDTIRNGTIKVYPDLTNLHLSMTLESTFRDSFINFARNSLTELGYDKSIVDAPIQIGEPIYGSAERRGYLEFMAPGVVISICYVMATGLTALAFILERRDGLLERSLVSGVQTSQILLAHSINQVVVMVIQIFLVLGFTFIIFEVPSRGPFFWVVLLILLQGSTGMCFGLLVSAICAEENTAVMMVVGTFYTNLILAGIIWPIEAMPHWIRPISYMQPQTLPTETLRHILSRGWNILEPAVLLGFAVTIGWLIVFLLSAGIIFKYSR